MTYYVFSSSEGFDRATASAHETLEDAGLHILGDNVASCGFDYIDGEYVPWQEPHQFPRKHLHYLARDTKTESLEAIAMSGNFGLECFSEERAARYEADGLE